MTYWKVGSKVIPVIRSFSLVWFDMHYGVAWKGEKEHNARAALPDICSVGMDRELLGPCEELKSLNTKKHSVCFIVFLNVKEVAFIYLSFWLHRLSLVMGCRLRCSVACETLVPHPRVEPKSACIGRRLLTTGPPGRSRSVCFNSQSLCLIALELPGECSVSAVEVKH